MEIIFLALLLAIGIYSTLGLAFYFLFDILLGGDNFDGVEMLRVMLTWPDMLF